MTRYYAGWLLLVGLLLLGAGRVAAGARLREPPTSSTTAVAARRTANSTAASGGSSGLAGTVAGSPGGGTGANATAAASANTSDVDAILGPYDVLNVVDRPKKQLGLVERVAYGRGRVDSLNDCEF
jgi:hypothetical protein